MKKPFHKITENNFLNDLIHTVRQKQYSNIRNAFVEKEYGICSIKGFDENKCIFIRIPKTASVSIHKSLFNHYPMPHYNWQVYKRIYGHRIYNEYFKFALVRNPYDRIVSTYFYFMNGGYSQWEKNWRDKHLSNINNFSDFVTKWLPHHFTEREHLYPQHYFICNSSFQLEVDFVGKFETLETDFEFITKKLGTRSNLQKLNISNRQADFNFYQTNETRKIISELYKKDFEIFAYPY